MTHRGSRVWAGIVGILFLLCGLYLTIGGAWLLSYGDTPFYLVSGIVMLMTSVLVFRKKKAALWLHALLIIATFLWTFYETGYDFWSMVPRVDIVGILGILLLLPFVSRGITRSGAAKSTLGVVCVLGIATLVVCFFLDPYDQAGELPTDKIAEAANANEMPAGDWRAWGRTQAGDRFSPLDQINTSNVKDLKVAWHMHTGDVRGPNDSAETTNEATPLAVNGTLYMCSTHQKLLSIDGASGKVNWTFDPHLSDSSTYQHLTCRGVSYYEVPQKADGNADNQQPKQCQARIFLPTNDGRMFAVDAKTGKACQDFGQNGSINLREPGMPYTGKGKYEATSPPVVAKGLVIQSGAVTDNGSVKEPSGVTRAFDAITGKLVWSFDPSNPDPNEPPGPNHKYQPNSPNSWITSSYDPKLGLIYIPTGVKTPDQWGGDRNKYDERFASGVLALHADTGKLAWFYQTVHHDLWDMDIPSQMSLVDIKRDGKTIPALYAPAKTGNIFVLDRRTGKPIVPAPEKQVATTKTVPGDHATETQPFSDLTLRPKKKLTGRDMWGGSMLDQMVCRIYFHTLKYDGIFTPPSTQGTLVYPGDLGVFEWGGISVNPETQTAIANPEFLPFVSKLVPRGPGNPKWPDSNAKEGGGESGLQHNYGAPYAVELSGMMNPAFTRFGFNIPCKVPPWGAVAGINLRTNKVMWRHRNGTLRDSLNGTPLPIQLPPMTIGMPSLGGSITTAGNVAFLAATNDNYIRAFDVRTGKRLWQARLPAGGQATPMTYSVNGKQYLVIYAGGHSSFMTKMGDDVIAYALPDSVTKSE